MPGVPQIRLTRRITYAHLRCDCDRQLRRAFNSRTLHLGLVWSPTRYSSEEIGDSRFGQRSGRQSTRAGGFGAMRKNLVFMPIYVRSILSRQACSPVATEGRPGGWVDFVFLRELTGGMYFGRPRRAFGRRGFTAYDTCVYSREETERICRLGFRIMRTNARRKLTVVDKANVLATSRLWRQTAREMSVEYPQVEARPHVRG